MSGGWSTWSEWSDCSSNCGQGFQRRDRKCDNPIPRWGGPMCEENHVERTKCSTPCPGTLDILFLSNRNIHKSSCGLCFWTSDPLIDRI